MEQKDIVNELRLAQAWCDVDSGEIIPANRAYLLGLLRSSADEIEALRASLASMSADSNHKMLVKDAEIAARSAATVAKQKEIDILEEGLCGAMAEIARLSRKESGDDSRSAASRTEAE
jgi:hypothetical protein